MTSIVVWGLFCFSSKLLQFSMCPFFVCISFFSFLFFFLNKILPLYWWRCTQVHVFKLAFMFYHNNVLASSICLKRALQIPQHLLVKLWTFNKNSVLPQKILHLFPHKQVNTLKKTYKNFLQKVITTGWVVNTLPSRIPVYWNSTRLL